MAIEPEGRQARAVQEQCIAQVRELRKLSGDPRWTIVFVGRGPADGEMFQAGRKVWTLREHSEKGHPLLRVTFRPEWNKIKVNTHIHFVGHVGRNVDVDAQLCEPREKGA